MEIKEISSELNTAYKSFLRNGLIEDEENFRMSPTDDANDPFPTKNRKDSFTLGAYVNHQLAGVVSFERDGANREKLWHKGTIFRMYVAKEFRGMGVSKLLMSNALDRIRELSDLEQVNLTVVVNNTLAKSLYEKFGFVTFGVEENAIKWKGKYFSEEQMVLRLI